MFRNTDFFGVQDENELFVLLGNNEPNRCGICNKAIEEKGLSVTAVDLQSEEKVIMIQSS